MPFSLAVYVPDRIIYSAAWGVVTTEQAVAVNQQIIDLFDQASGPIHLISDFRHLVEFPKSITQAASTYTLFQHPRHDWQFVLTDDRLISFISTLVVQVSKRKVGQQKLVITPDPADLVQRLERLCPDLAPLPPLPDLPSEVRASIAQ